MQSTSEFVRSTFYAIICFGLLFMLRGLLVWLFKIGEVLENIQSLAYKLESLREDIKKNSSDLDIIKKKLADLKN